MGFEGHAVAAGVEPHRAAVVAAMQLLAVGPRLGQVHAQRLEPRADQASRHRQHRGQRLVDQESVDLQIKLARHHLQMDLVPVRLHEVIHHRAGGGLVGHRVGHRIAEGFAGQHGQARNAPGDRRLARADGQTQRRLLQRTLAAQDQLAQLQMGQQQVLVAQVLVGEAQATAHALGRQAAIVDQAQQGPGDAGHDVGDAAGVEGGWRGHASP
mmetsp:Transcript_37529/g.87563  ORF Transcript_37529/g.87563 Transcript_37529/m.87563 type:complete len:212 (-) Transcript_37529:1045-1680(-)